MGTGKTVYALRASNQVLKKSTSGGAFSLIVDAVYQITNIDDKPPVVYGAAFDNELNVMHSGAESRQDCNKFCGSKYVQSKIRDSLPELAKHLKYGRVVVFASVPCQVNAVKNYLKKKNINCEKLFTIDLLCHGSPSNKIWKDYVEWLQKKRNKKLVNFSFRTKQNIHYPYYARAEYSDGSYEFATQETQLYIELFFSSLAYNVACYHCKFASEERTGDLTIGDFWGVEKVMPELPPGKGTSLMIVNNEKGQILAEQIRNMTDVVMQQCYTDEYINYQDTLSCPVKKSSFYHKFTQDYASYDFDYVAKQYLRYNFTGKLRFILKKAMLNTGFMEKLIDK